METKNATIYDIAQICGCSPATVSLALNNDNRVAEKTKRKVQEIAQELKYQPSYIGRSLITGKTKAIKVVVPDLHNPVFINIVDGVEAYIDQTDYHVILEVTHNDKNKEINSFDSFLDKKVDGVIISPIYEEEVTDYLLKKGINLQKVVYVGDICRGTDKIHYCAADSKKGAYDGVKNMIENGCKRVAFLAPTVAKLQSSKRLDGYRQALEESGIPVEQSLIINCNQEFTEIYKCARQLLQEKKPDGIFCLYDYAAIPVFKAATDMGIRVPDELMVTGYDNIEIGAFLEQSLTTVDPHQKEQGCCAAEIMIKMLQGEECSIENIIEPTLVVRQSTVNRKYNQIREDDKK